MKFSVVTCISNFDMYRETVVNSIQKLKNANDIELIEIDNTNNQHNCPSALNEGIERASNDIVVLCHQDIEFSADWNEKLQQQLELMEKIDTNWAVLGVFGVDFNNRYAGHILDPHESKPYPPLPRKVQSLDECCLIMRKSSGFRFDEELGGFHFYGGDISLQVRTVGKNIYAIDTCIKHLSPGNVNDSFYKMSEKFMQKWRGIEHDIPIIVTTCGYFRIKKGLYARLVWLIAKTQRKFRTLKSNPRSQT